VLVTLITDVADADWGLALGVLRLFFFLHEHELEKHKVWVIQPAVQFSNKEN
jgi:hypothetical protein